MERNVDLNEISDGKLYSLNDMVKTGCNDCEGCSACCQGMGSSIILDPLDIHRLIINLNRSFEELLADRIELNVSDGIIMPNLKMSGETEKCSFLNSEGRCSIHGFRPGICRLFPLGRLYEDNSFKYILQVHECPKAGKTKVKVKKWIDTPDLAKNEKFVNDWHYFLKDLQAVVKSTEDEALVKNISMYVLKMFYMKPFDASEDFYKQFEDRLDEAKKTLW